MTFHGHKDSCSSPKFLLESCVLLFCRYCSMSSSLQTILLTNLGFPGSVIDKSIDTHFGHPMWPSPCARQLPSFIDNSSLVGPDWSSRCLYIPPYCQHLIKISFLALAFLLPLSHTYSSLQLTSNIYRYTSFSIDILTTNILLKQSFMLNVTSTLSNIIPFQTSYQYQHQHRYHEDYEHHLHCTPRSRLNRGSRNRKPSTCSSRRSRTSVLLPFSTTLP